MNINRKIHFVATGIRCAIEVETKPAQLKENGRTIDLLPIPADAVELSISGEAAGHLGQCVETIREAGAGNADIQRLCDIWDRYHLNGLKAGTRAQLHYLESVPNAKGYDEIKAALGFAGLDPDRNTAPDSPPYSYGSAWLFEPVPAEILAELAALLDRLDDTRIGDAPDIEDAPEIGGDYIDSRDIVARLEIFRAAVEMLGVDPDTVDADFNHGMPEGSEDWDVERTDIVSEFVALRDLDSELSEVGDWNFGATLIRESYFTEYAKELADGCGMTDREAKWPNNHLDWNGAAEELKTDYREVKFNGETYLVRE